MLKREVLLSKLGITEEQVKEFNLDVDSVLTEVQTLGDGIANKGNAKISELEATIETLSTKKDNEVEKENGSKGLSMDEVNEMIAKALGKVTEETNKTNKVNEFKKLAKENGLNEKQIEKFAKLPLEELDNFDFGIVPIVKEEDLGNGKQENQAGQATEAEFLSYLGLTADDIK